jgi:hypothetical protein
VPEICSGLDKFHPDLRDARFTDGAEIHHAASELLLRHYIPDRQQFAHRHGRAEQYQCAMDIYDHGFSVLWRQLLLCSIEANYNLHAYVDPLTSAKVTELPQLWIDGIHGDAHPHFLYRQKHRKH